MFSRLAVILSAALVALAQVTPTEPGPGDVDNQGAACNIEWTPDATGIWKSLNIQLMTGDNIKMIPLTSTNSLELSKRASFDPFLPLAVASNIDGTATPGTFSFPCPAVRLDHTYRRPVVTQSFFSPRSLLTRPFTSTSSAHRLSRRTLRGPVGLPLQTRLARPFPHKMRTSPMANRSLGEQARSSTRLRLCPLRPTSQAVATPTPRARPRRHPPTPLPLSPLPPRCCRLQPQEPAPRRRLNRNRVLSYLPPLLPQAARPRLTTTRLAVSSSVRCLRMRRWPASLSRSSQPRSRSYSEQPYPFLLFVGYFSFITWLAPFVKTNAPSRTLQLPFIVQSAVENFPYPPIFFLLGRSGICFYLFRACLLVI